jgi:hypothetical protein
MNGRTLALMAIREQRQGATTDYLKNRDLVRRQLNVDLVLLLLDHVPNAIRRRMVDWKIGFIAPGVQLYVPEAFLDLRERVPAFTIAPCFVVACCYVTPLGLFILRLLPSRDA